MSADEFNEKMRIQAMKALGTYRDPETPEKPNYYRRPIHGQEIQIYDVENAWDLGRHEAAAVEYILRAKYKENEKQDLKKAIQRLERRILEIEDVGNKIQKALKP